MELEQTLTTSSSSSAPSEPRQLQKQNYVRAASVMDGETGTTPMSVAHRPVIRLSWLNRTVTNVKCFAISHPLQFFLLLVLLIAPQLFVKFLFSRARMIMQQTAAETTATAKEILEMGVVAEVAEQQFIPHTVQLKNQTNSAAATVFITVLAFVGGRFARPQPQPLP
eukprot:TRINITY_DN25595_c0_g1_i1.p2 TRINITY_DN25595_c0_g1~~TRINITY_DN25595_c0_g1_i1.p2  ORF type:complete len:167 (-),score=12.81 TRINITY_DN25595_c0_g1_i1:196-696(-)